MTTLDGLLFAVAFITTLGCGLIAGLFFAFSVSVMKGLGRLPPAGGIAAMQSINVVIVNPVFLSVFFGSGVGCIVVMIASVQGVDGPGRYFLLAGGALYLVGSILVTVVANVPRNNALAAVAPIDPAGVSVWVDYLHRWTVWNHVRTVASLAATASLILGLPALGPSHPA